MTSAASPPSSPIHPGGAGATLQELVDVPDPLLLDLIGLGGAVAAPRRRARPISVTTRCCRTGPRTRAADAAAISAPDTAAVRTEVRHRAVAGLDGTTWWRAWPEWAGTRAMASRCRRTRSGRDRPPRGGARISGNISSYSPRGASAVFQPWLNTNRSSTPRRRPGQAAHSVGAVRRPDSSKSRSHTGSPVASRPPCLLFRRWTAFASDRPGPHPARSAPGRGRWRCSAGAP